MSLFLCLFDSGSQMGVAPEKSEKNKIKDNIREYVRIWNIFGYACNHFFQIIFPSGMPDKESGYSPLSPAQKCRPAIKKPLPRGKGLRYLNRIGIRTQRVRRRRTRNQWTSGVRHGRTWTGR